MKRILGILMITVMVLGLVPLGMASSADNVYMEGLPIVKEPIVIQGISRRNPLHGDFSDMWFLNEIEERTGIKIILDSVEEAGWTEKKNLLFAAGDYPELFIDGVTLNEASIYGQQGILIPINEYFEYAPNLAKLYEEYPDAYNSLAAADGNIYMQCNLVTNDWDVVMNPRDINVAWLEKLDLSEPLTTDELYETLKAFKEGDPNGNGVADEIPMSAIYDVTKSVNDPVLLAFGLVDYKHDLMNGNEYVYVPTHENFRAYLEFMNRLFVEGLLDSEMFTQTEDQFIAKEQAGLVGFNVNPHNIRLASLEPLTLEYNQITPLTSPVNDSPIWRRNYVVNASFPHGYAITDKCQNIEAAVRLLDYFMTNEGTLLVKGGPMLGEVEEDSGLEVTYDEKGEPTFTIHLNTDKWESFWNFRMKYSLQYCPFLNDNFQIGITVLNDRMYRKMFDDVNNSVVPEVMRFGYPNMSFDLDTMEELNALEVVIDTYSDQMMAKFITGDLPITDENWDEFQSTMQSMGVENIFRIRQAGYDNWASKGQE